MQFLPCFLGGERLEKRTDKNGKPYFVCNNCGIQLFVRKALGIELLDTLLRNIAKNEIPFKQCAEEVYKIQALLTEINGVKVTNRSLGSANGLLLPGSRQNPGV